MDRARILIVGQTKENSYEIRNLLDNRRFELEIALSKDMGKTILSSRLMGLLVVHTETLGQEDEELFSFLEDEGIPIPVMILGEEAERFRERIPGARKVACFDKPYPVDDMMTYISSL